MCEPAGFISLTQKWKNVLNKKRVKLFLQFLDVVQLVHQKSWKVGDIFHAVVQFCKLHEESGEPTPSLFDWLLELG